MSSLAVFAHYDPDGCASSYVLRHLESLAEVSDHVVVVTTAQLTADARRALSHRGELIERANEGYDFYSWKVGLEHSRQWPTVSRLILSNDSVVGPLVPYSQILDRMEERGAAFWGGTASNEGGPHLQSYLLGFSRPAVSSPLLEAFFRDLPVLPTRADVIAHCEHGLSRLLRIAGMEGDAYFTPSEHDDRVARRRRARQVRIRTLRSLGELPDDARPSWTVRRATGRRKARECLRPGTPYNPMIALWDRALAGRLPFVKIETLRDDPYELDRRDRALKSLERTFPAHFDGVRSHLQRTRVAYESVGRGRRTRTT